MQKERAIRGTAWGALLTLLWASSAAAVNVAKYEVPYFGVGAEYLQADSARESGHGDGFQLTVGVPLSEPQNALEVRLFDGAIHDRWPDGKKDYQSGLFVDYLHDFGPIGAADDDRAFAGIKPFLAGGLGFLREDVRGVKHQHFGLDAGGGMLVPLGFKGWGLRLDGRVQAQSNDRSAPPPSDRKYLVDYQITLGLQLPMTWFFDRAIRLENAQECPVAVVDPKTGRRDCSIDSDGDGVPDSVDQCPGTQPGIPVDRAGCAKGKDAAVAPNDEDGDGVADSADKCPHTEPGLKVDARGCLIAQKTAMPGVTFQANSARLTLEGREALDGVAESLRAQPEIKLEVAGHTDNVGSDAYNTLLSQQRADAVRAYLISKGIEEARLSAVGYGELEPLASNDTEEGRRTNRRVEFRISTD